MNAFTALLPYFNTYGYLAIFVILYFSAAYLPFPANIALLGAGVLSRFSSDGIHFNIFIAAAVALAGNVLGDLSGYFISRKFSSEKRREKFEQKYKSFHKMEKYLKDHPFLTIGTTRLLGFLSPIVNSLAGFTKLSFSTFFWSDLIGNTFYTILYMGAGYLIGSASNNIVDLLEIIVGVVALIGMIYGIALYLLNKE